jgi:hypothetical protein
MKKYSRVFLFGALILTLLMAGCAGQEETATSAPGGNVTSFPTMEATSAVGTAETQTTGTAETAITGTAETETTSTSAATQEATQATTGTATTGTPGVPVTGGDINVLDCQFCISTMAYALLDIPAVATFEITEPASPSTDTQCNVVDTFQDRQVVFCRAPEDTSLTVNVCTDANACSPVTVTLQKCPLAATAQPDVSTTQTPGETGTATVGTAEASPTGPTAATPTP